METVLRLDPDVIIDTVDMGDTDAERRQRQPVNERLWSAYGMLTAVKTRRVHAATTDALVVPGPRVVDAAQWVASLLQSGADGDDASVADRRTWRGKSAGRPVLSGVTFDVRGGEVAVVMGRNGAGKSTLLDIVAGLRAVDWRRRAARRSSSGCVGSASACQVIAHLPQIVRPDLPFLAGELVLMGRYPHTGSLVRRASEDRAAVERAMRRTDCWDLRDRLLQTLSGGERQRVLLAACFAQEPAAPAARRAVDPSRHRSAAALLLAAAGGERARRRVPAPSRTISTWRWPTPRA